MGCFIPATNGWAIGVRSPSFAFFATFVLKSESREFYTKGDKGRRQERQDRPPAKGMCSSFWPATAQNRDHIPGSGEKVVKERSDFAPFSARITGPAILGGMLHPGNKWLGRHCRVSVLRFLCGLRVNIQILNRQDTRIARPEGSSQCGRRTPHFVGALRRASRRAEMLFVVELLSCSLGL